MPAQSDLYWRIFCREKAKILWAGNTWSVVSGEVCHSSSSCYLVVSVSISNFQFYWAIMESFGKFTVAVIMHISLWVFSVWSRKVCMNYQWNPTHELGNKRLAGIEALKICVALKVKGLERGKAEQSPLFSQRYRSSRQRCFFWKSFMINSQGVFLNL